MRMLDVRLCAVLGVLCAASLVQAQQKNGGIRAQLETDAKVAKAWAVQRVAKQMTTSKGRTKDIGMYADRHAGRIDGQRVTFDELPVPGRYDLRFETEDGGIVQGWDATVPESDYVGDPPLEDWARKRILEKQADDQFTAFADRVRVLDMTGNVQHAAVLVAKLRWRPFVGGGYQPGEWVWRVERWRWSDPNEQTWVPYADRPFYALVRERLHEKDYRKKAVVYARHLGGLVLTGEAARRDLGTLKVPAPGGGVYAVDPDGERIDPVVIKGEGNPIGGE